MLENEIVKTEAVTPTYIHVGSSTYRADGKPLTEDEIPRLIAIGRERMFRLKEEHQQGKRNVFHDHTFNDDEKRFFTALVEELTMNNLKPGLVKLSRLSSGIWNVDYVSVCYVGKIQFLPRRKTPDKYAVLKHGYKRALRVLDTQEEAEAYKLSTGGDEIQVRPGNTIGGACMQYSIGNSSHAVLQNASTDECIAMIPKWVEYIKYCECHPVYS